VLHRALLLLVFTTARLGPGLKAHLKFPPLFSRVAVRIAVEGRQVPKYCFVDLTLYNYSCKLLTSGFSFLKGRLHKYYPKPTIQSLNHPKCSQYLAEMQRPKGPQSVRGSVAVELIEFERV